MLNNSYKELIIRLDGLIRKYYRQKILKGFLLSIVLIIALIAVIAIAEHFGYFGTQFRTALFFGYLLLAGSVLVIYVAIPLSKLYRIGKTLSYSDAALIVQRHFPHIQDKMLNALQLGSLGNRSSDEDFINAAIEQKTKEFSGLNLGAAISPREWTRKIPYAVGMAVAFLVSILLFPSVFKEPIKRIAMYDTEFERPERFRFIIDTNNLKVLHGEDFELIVGIEGEVIPAEVVVESSRGRLTMQKIDNSWFKTNFNSIKEDVHFSLSANGVTSGKYTIKRIPRSRIIEMELKITPPKYTGIEPIKHKNKTDIIAPVASQLEWTFITKDTDSIYSYLLENHQRVKVLNKMEDVYFSEFTAEHPTYFIIKPENRFGKSRDSIIININIIPDLYPRIDAEFERSVDGEERIFVTGSISDDYGFSELKRIIQMYDEGMNLLHDGDTTKITFVRDQTNQVFFDVVETIGFERKLVREVRVWYEVSDNDGFAGNKTSRSRIYSKRILSIEEISQETEVQKERFMEEGMETKNMLNEISRQIAELQKTILQKEYVTWDESRRLSELIEKHDAVMQSIEQGKRELRDITRKKERIHSDDLELLNRFKEMSELFEKVVDEELKEKIEQLRRMLHNLEKSTMNEQLENLKLTNEEIMKQLDRNIELFKRMDVENRIMEIADRLEELAMKQEKLKIDTESQEKSISEINQKQEEIREEFGNIEEALTEAKQTNQELEFEIDLPEVDEDLEEIWESLNDASSTMNEGSRQKLMSFQGKSSKGMSNMSKRLQAALQDSMIDQLGEDIDRLRQMLENLVELSFNQETIINRTLTIDRNDPRYMQLMDDQQDMSEQMERVSDSLMQIAKRQITIQPFVIRETEKAKTEIKKAIESLANRNLSMAGTRQQFAMTSINSLSLMLSEAIGNLMNQMNSMKAGQGKGCPRPGRGQPSISQIRGMQNQLNSQIEGMMNELAGKRDGQKMSEGSSGLSERFARMAAKQEELRRRMQDILNEITSETGLRQPGLQRAIQEMEMTERELVNRDISRETVLRQERISTRLLESEKAETERELDHIRESREAVQHQRIRTAETEAAARTIESETEIIRKTSKEFIHFFRNKAEEYLFKIQNHDHHIQPGH